MMRSSPNNEIDIILTTPRSGSAASATALLVAPLHAVFEARGAKALSLNAEEAADATLKRPK